MGRVQPLRPDSLSPSWLLETGDLRGLPPPAWLLHGFFPRRGVTMLSGPTSVGKSQVVMALGGAVAYAQIWGGEPFEPGLVISVVSENFDATEDRRRAWCLINEVDPDVEIDAICWVDGERHRFNLRTDIPKLDAEITRLKRLKNRPVGLITLDHLRRMQRGARSRGGFAAQEIIEHLEDLARKHNCAVVLVAHATKSSEMLAGPPEYSTFTQANFVITQSPDRSIVTLHGGKQRDGKPADLVFRRLAPIVRDAGTDRPITSAALKFKHFSGMHDENTKHHELRIQVAVAMQPGEYLKYSQLTVRLGQGVGGEQNKRLKAAIPREWIVVALPGAPAKSLRRCTMNGKEIFACETPVEITSPYPDPGAD